MVIEPLVVRLLIVKTLLPEAFPTYVLANDKELGVEEISVVCCAEARTALAASNKREAAHDRTRFDIFMKNLSTLGDQIVARQELWPKTNAAMYLGPS